MQRRHKVAGLLGMYMALYGILVFWAGWTELAVAMWLIGGSSFSYIGLTWPVRR